MLRPGIDLLLDAVGFDRLAKDADLIFTVEGCLDGQTLRGKAVSGVARRAKTLGVPVVAVVGGSRGCLDDLYDLGLTAAFSINRLPQTLQDSAPHTAQNLAFTMENILRLLEAAL